MLRNSLALATPCNPPVPSNAPAPANRYSVELYSVLASNTVYVLASVLLYVPLLSQPLSSHSRIDKLLGSVNKTSYLVTVFFSGNSNLIAYSLPNLYKYAEPASESPPTSFICAPTKTEFP